jgi:hypothetical protein
MLLHELPKKTVRRLRKSVTWTDIAVNPATIALHGLIKGLARGAQWLPRLLMKETVVMTQSLNGMEHRWGERIQVDLQVTVSANQAKRIRGWMRNLSLSGALLKIDADLRLHALIEVCVELPPPSRHPARLLAHVARRSEEDVGIEWCEFAPIVVKDLLRLPTVWLSL